MNPYRYASHPEYDFNNEADFRKLEKQAYDGVISIQHFPPAAYRYFDKLRNIYRAYKFDGLNQADAKKMKSEAYSEYLEAKSAYEEWCSVFAEYQDNIRQTCTIITKIEKSHDVREIAGLACKAISLLTGEASFAQRQKAKWEADTSSSYYIICPYCGYAIDACYGYEEGEHEIECPECGKTYIMEINISYDYETRRTNNE